MNIYDFKNNVVDEATQRWNERQNKRDSDKESLAENQIASVETPERIHKNLERMTKVLIQQDRKPIERTNISPPKDVESVTFTQKSFLSDISKERIIGNSDLMGVEFLERGIAVGRFVGRVNVRNNQGITIGYGTGFMVSPNLLLTNNHVLENSQIAKSSVIEFDYQLDRRGTPLPVAPFRLQPELFFVTDEGLDYTLIAVAPLSMNDIPISHYGWNRLIEEEGKILISQPVNIIQHPNGDYKQLVLRENKLVDLLPEFAHYTADTKPGSSGSPVFSDLWEVIALHHSAVPKKDTDGNLIAKDNTIWEPGMSPLNLDWIANEGIRISSLVKNFKTKLNQLSRPARKLADDLLHLEAPNPLEVMEDAANANNNVFPVNDTDSSLPPSNQMTPQLGTEAVWTFPLQVKVAFGTPQLQNSVSIEKPEQQPTNTPVNKSIDVVTEEAVTVDPDYNNRSGYKVNFLGNGKKKVTLPKLSSEMKTLAARNRMGNDNNPYELKYHNSSIVMNKVRRLAFFTAVNIDGNKSRSPNRETDRWFYDPRIKKEEQNGNELYIDNPLDRGHLVRRLDPAWGDNDQMVKTANDDTFHWTNCSPQHKSFNRGKNIWAGLEDYVLKNANNKDFKVSVFTGPVFSDNDSVYRGVKIPKQYWKVVMMLKSKKQLSATAYIVSQSKLIENIEADFAFGQYKTFQTSIENIEQLTGLDFGNLKFSQPTNTESLVFNESVSESELSDYSEIKL